MRKPLPELSAAGGRDRRRRGSVLIMTLVLLSLLASVSVSFQASVSSQVAVSRNRASSLHAELAGLSGLEFAHRMLKEDHEWAGTGYEPVDMGDGYSFRVTRLDAPVPPPATAELLVEGFHDEAVFKLGGRIEVEEATSPLDTAAIVAFGSENSFHNVDVVGDVLIADDRSQVHDWHGDIQSYSVTDSALVRYQFSSGSISGDVYSYNGATVADRTPKVAESPVYMPAPALSSMLSPSGDRVILVGTDTISGATYEQTVIVVLPPGATLSIEDSQLNGGLVVWAPDEFDLRNGPRNVVEINRNVTIGGGSGGIHSSIGLIAPAASFEPKPGAGTKVLHGFHFVNGIDTDTHVELHGQLVVVNDIRNFNVGSIIFDPHVAANRPPGLFFPDPGNLVDLAAIGEHHDLPDEGPRP